MNYTNRFGRNSKTEVFASGTDAIWTADLVDMQSFSKSKKGFKYEWAIPLKTKTGPEVAKAFQDLWTTQKPTKKLWTDKGKGFYNKSMKDLLEKNNVQLYSTENEEKSSIVERWNRTIKRNMWKYFSANNTMNYIPNLIKKYTGICNGTIELSTRVRHIYNLREDNVEVKPKFKIGDRVRKAFEKGFTPIWKEELFIVSGVRLTNPVTYNIKDLKGATIKGAFYQQELQKTNQQVYRIDKVSRKTKRNDGTKEALVKWKGYSNDFNYWVPESDIQE